MPRRPSILLPHVTKSLGAPQGALNKGGLDEFQAALGRATAIYESLPDELTCVIPMKREIDGPELAFKDRVTKFVSDQVPLLESARMAMGYKMEELVTGICDGLNARKFRIAALSCRALLEDAATAKFYLEKSFAQIRTILTIPPSTFRAKRLLDLARNKKVDYEALMTTLFNADLHKLLLSSRAAYSASFEMREMPKDHFLFQTNVLTTVKKLTDKHWKEPRSAYFYYAELCEITHPNGSANLWCADELRSSKSHQFMELLFRKERQTDHSDKGALQVICRPTIVSINILENLMKEAHDYKLELERYLRRIRSVP